MKEENEKKRSFKIEYANEIYEMVDNTFHFGAKDLEHLKWLYSKFSSPEEIINILLLDTKSCNLHKFNSCGKQEKLENFIISLCMATKDISNFNKLLIDHIKSRKSLVFWREIICEMGRFYHDIRDTHIKIVDEKLKEFETTH